MARIRTRKMVVKTKLIIDTIGASLIVQKAPVLINPFFPLDPMIAKIAGVGAGWLTGTLMKRPDISTVSLALGVVDLLTPMFDNLVGGTQMLPAELVIEGNGNGNGNYATNIQGIKHAVADYGRLRDYTNNPGYREGYSMYQDSY